MELPLGLVLVQGVDGRMAVTRPVASSPAAAAAAAAASALPLSTIGLSFDASGNLVPDALRAAIAGDASAALNPEELIQSACGFDLYSAALRAIEELLALQLEAGVKHLQRAQEEGSAQAQRMLPILAAQKAAKRQLHQALTLVQSDEVAATQFAVGIKSICANYSEELELCIRVLGGVETFLLQAGAWLAQQVMGQPLEPIMVAALVSFSAAGSQTSAARGLLQDALQYWD